MIIVTTQRAPQGAPEHHHVVVIRFLLCDAVDLVDVLAHHIEHRVQIPRASAVNDLPQFAASFFASAVASFVVVHSSWHQHVFIFYVSGVESAVTVECEGLGSLIFALVHCGDHLVSGKSGDLGVVLRARQGKIQERLRFLHIHTLVACTGRSAGLRQRIGLDAHALLLSIRLLEPPGVAQDGPSVNHCVHHCVGHGVDVTIGGVAVNEVCKPSTLSLVLHIGQPCAAVVGSILVCLEYDLDVFPVIDSAGDGQEVAEARNVVEQMQRSVVPQLAKSGRGDRSMECVHVRDRVRLCLGGLNFLKDFPTQFDCIREGDNSRDIFQANDVQQETAQTQRNPDGSDTQEFP